MDHPVMLIIYLEDCPMDSYERIETVNETGEITGRKEREIECVIAEREKRTASLIKCAGWDTTRGDTWKQNGR